MSTPTRQFRKLNIGKAMPQTRSQARRREQAAARGDSVLPSIEGPGNAIPAQPERPYADIIQGRSRQSYDVHQLSPASRSRAVEGLPAEFIVDRSQHYENPAHLGGPYHALQLKIPCSLRIFDSLVENPVRCTCDVYTQTHAACVHIYWLFDGLNRILVDETRTTPQILTNEGMIRQISNLYELIGERLEVLPELLSRWESSRSYSPNDLQERREAVRDMLSVFEDVLPNDYGRDFIDIVPERSTPFEQLFIRENLAATIFALALHDDEFYSHLRKVLSRDLCANIYFKKQAARARKALISLDQFAVYGPSQNIGQSSSTGVIAESENLRHHDVGVPACAYILRKIVHDVRVGRNERAPISASVHSNAAKVLVDILEELCKRNVDIYEDAEWDWSSYVEDGNENDRNLYLQLIGDPPIDDRLQPAWRTDDFVIDALSDFPPYEWRHLLDRMTTIFEKIQEYEAPEYFVAKFQGLLAEHSSPPYQPSSSPVHERPDIGNSQPERQRRRL